MIIIIAHIIGLIRICISISPAATDYIYIWNVYYSRVRSTGRMQALTGLSDGMKFVQQESE